jgi:hypothetical protein
MRLLIMPAGQKHIHAKRYMTKFRGFVDKPLYGFPSLELLKIPLLQGFFIYKTFSRGQLFF